MPSTPIAPHGGKLINRMVTGSQHESLLEQAKQLPSLTLNSREMSDLDMIACGALSPLEGFMGEKDYRRVVDEMLLTNGLPWTIPITLSGKKRSGGRIRNRKRHCAQIT